MTETLQDKVAVVTGGAVGIGAAVAKKFASLGAHVVVQGLPGDPVREVVLEIQQSGHRADEFIGDISVEAYAEECINFATSFDGRLDILVNAAGAPLAELPVDHHRVSDFDHMIYANLRSVFLMTKFALPYLQQSAGVILSLGADHFSTTMNLNPVYSATQAWIHAFMKGVALEGAAFSVRANTVSAGLMESRTLAAMFDVDPKSMDNLLVSTALRRRGSPEEISSVFAFLASEKASYITGGLFTVDGGLSLPHLKSTSVGMSKKGRELNHQSAERESLL